MALARVLFLTQNKDRSSRPEVFCKKGALRNFAKFTGKHLCLRPATLLKGSLWHRCFPVNFVKFLRILLFTEQPRGLLQQGSFCREKIPFATYVR